MVGERGRKIQTEIDRDRERQRKAKITKMTTGIEMKRCFKNFL